MHTDVSEILISSSAISLITANLAEQIRGRFKNHKDLVLLTALKGAAVFSSELMLKMSDLPIRTDFVELKSYDGTESTGRVDIVKFPSLPLKGVDVLLVEDIVDTGISFDALKKLLMGADVASLTTCALLSKPSRRKIDITADFVGQEIDNHFVVGYGLDFNQKYRNLPYIGILKEEIYSE